MNSRQPIDQKVLEQFTAWCLKRVPEADTAKMLALLGLRKRRLDLTGVSRLLVDAYLDIVQRGANEGMNEHEIVAWLWSALERRVLRPAAP